MCNASVGQCQFFCRLQCQRHNVDINFNARSTNAHADVSNIIVNAHTFTVNLHVHANVSIANVSVTANAQFNVDANVRANVLIVRARTYMRGHTRARAPLHVHTYALRVCTERNVPVHVYIARALCTKCLARPYGYWSGNANAPVCNTHANVNDNVF